MSVDEKDRAAPGYSPFSNGGSLGWDPEKEKKGKYDEEALDERARRRQSSIAEGKIKHNKLGWKRLTVCVPHLLQTFTALAIAAAHSKTYADVLISSDLPHR